MSEHRPDSLLPAAGDNGEQSGEDSSPIRRPTLRDVARISNVSLMTASRALNGQDRVAPKTRQRVLGVAQELGYRPSQSARVLRSSESQTIGLVSTNLSLPLRFEIILGARDAATQLGHKLLLEVNVPGDGESIPFTTDGDLVFGDLASAQLRDVRRTVRLMGITEEIDCCVTDLSEAAYVATMHMVDRGYRRIGLIQHSGGMPAIGRKAALDELGIADPDHEELVRHVAYDDASVVNAVERLLELTNPPDSLLVVNIAATPVVLRTLQQHQVRIGNDMGFIGTEISRTEWGDLISPPLTTIRISGYRIGASGAQRLIERLRGDTSPPQIIDFPAKFIIRESTQGPGERRFVSSAHKRQRQ